MSLFKDMCHGFSNLKMLIRIHVLVYNERNLKFLTHNILFHIYELVYILFLGIGLLFLAQNHSFNIEANKDSNLLIKVRKVKNSIGL